MNMTIKRLTAIVLIAAFAGIFAAACGKQEEAKPKSGSYYEGPMKPKGAPGAGSKPAPYRTEPEQEDLIFKLRFFIFYQPKRLFFWCDIKWG